MKKSLLTLTLYFLSLNIFSQEIKYEKGKFYQNGEQISKKELKSYLSTIDETKKLYQEINTKKNLGGFLLGFGGGLVLTDLILAGQKWNYVYPKSVTFIGLGSMALSIPVLSGRKKKMEKAISIFNSNQKNSGLNEKYQFHIVSNQNGIGLKYSF